MPQFRYTILYVQDVVRTITFYETAFGFTRRFIAPGDQYGELDTGSTILSFARHDLAKTNLKNGYQESQPGNRPFGIEIGITTDDVPETMQQAISAGASLLENPITKPWGQVVGYVTDPDGFLIEVCSPME